MRSCGCVSPLCESNPCARVEVPAVSPNRRRRCRLPSGDRARWRLPAASGRQAFLSPSFAVAFSNQVAALCARKFDPGYSGSSPIAVDGMLLDALVSLAMSVGRCRLRLLHRCYHSEPMLIARSGWNGPSLGNLRLNSTQNIRAPSIRPVTHSRHIPHSNPRSVPSMTVTVIHAP